MNPTIEALALKRPFELLDPEQQEQVLAEMSAADYDRLHWVLQAAPTLDTDRVPSAALRSRVLAHLPQRPAFYLRTIPVWQAAAVFFLGLGVAWMFRTHPAPGLPVERIVVKTDTVVQERVVLQDVVKWREKTVYRVLEMPAMMPTVAAEAVDTAPVARVGRSLQDEPELERFFVRTDR
jgi:hypothetical protein